MNLSILKKISSEKKLNIEKLSYDFAKDHFETINSMTKDEILKKVLSRSYAKKAKPLSEKQLKELLTDKAEKFVKFYEFKIKLLGVF